MSLDERNHASATLAEQLAETLAAECGTYPELTDRTWSWQVTGPFGATVTVSVHPELAATT